MNDNQIVDSSFSAIINAPIDRVDIPAWCFALTESEYRACSPAHIAAGFTTAPDGKRMSINVEMIGGSLMVQHYVETFADKSRLDRQGIPSRAPIPVRSPPSRSARFASGAPAGRPSGDEVRPQKIRRPRRMDRRGRKIQAQGLGGACARTFSGEASLFAI